MKKSLQTLGACVAIVLLAAIAGVFNLDFLAPRPDRGVAGNTEKTAEPVPDPLNTSYLIAGEPVFLIDGVSEKPAIPGSAARIVTRYFGNDLSLDLDNDGREDRIFLLTQQTGGSGTFFYAVAALYTAEGWIGSHGFFLGDRIEPRNTEVSADPNHQNVVKVDFADRVAGQPMSAQPSVTRSVWIKFDVDTRTFSEIDQDYSGEANPDMMALGMRTWTWVRTTYNNDTELTPGQADQFTLTFRNDGIVSATTDCNTMSSTYEVSENRIDFGPVAATRMFCQDSQEQDFTALLEEAQSFFFTPKGELVIELKFDSGSAIFR